MEYVHHQPSARIATYALLSIALLLLIAAALRTSDEEYQAIDWVPVKGRLVQFDLGPPVGGSRLPRYSPAVVYEYTVNGVTRRSTRLSFHPLDTRQELSRFRQGAEVMVYYDPDVPGESIIKKEWPRNAFSWLGLYLLFAGIAMFVQDSRAWRRLTTADYQRRRTLGAFFLESPFALKALLVGNIVFLSWQAYRWDRCMTWMSQP